MITYIKKNNKKIIIIILSYLGLIPFIYPLIKVELATSFFGIVPVEFIISYGVTILCFLSGSYWGIGLYYYLKNVSDFYNYCILSMIPFFIGLSAIFINNYNNALILIVGFLVCQIFDENLYKLNFYEKWYLSLRRILTFIVVSILIFIYIKYGNGYFSII